MTARREPRFRWFADSLFNEAVGATDGTFEGVRVVVVDLYAGGHRDGDGWTEEQAAVRRDEFREYLQGFRDVVITPPIWGPWQGPHRLTREHWFAKADYLNAAACYTSGEWLVSCDDLAVLMPGWFDAVRRAVGRPGVVTCGAYRKVKNMAVRDGKVVSYREHPPGEDVRWAYGHDHAATACRGNRMFGCSFAVPIEAVEKVNGWPQMSNGLGFEDSPNGLVIERAGYNFVYDRRMLTWESEDEHHIAPPLRRSDYGDSPNDKSHKFLAIAQETTRWPQFGEEGLAGVRRRVLAGEPLPIVREPTHEWFTSRPLSEL